jgi:hypothetical protein
MGRFARRVLPSATVAITVVAFMLLDQWLDAYGPIVLSGQHWLGKVLSVALFVIGILLLIGFGSARLYWDGRFLPVAAVLIASLALLFMFGAIEDAVTEHAFSERGRTISCRVLHVEKRVERTISGVPPVSVPVTNTFYDHRLDCGATLGRIMITDGGPAGDPGQYIQVQYDPAGRIDPRFAENVDDPGFPLLPYGVGLVFAVGLWSFAESRAGGKAPAEPPGGA